MNLICKIFGHQTYNQSHRYDYKERGEKKPFIEKICFRCGKTEKRFLSKKDL